MLELLLHLFLNVTQVIATETVSTATIHGDTHKDPF